MATKLTLQELQDLHFTSVEKFFKDWLTKKINQIFLKKLSNTNSNVAEVVLKLLEDGRNPLIANGSKIRDQSRRWNESDKVIKRWKERYQFDVVLFILNYEQETKKLLKFLKLKRLKNKKFNINNSKKNIFKAKKILNKSELRLIENKLKNYLQWPKKIYI